MKLYSLNLELNTIHELYPYSFGVDVLVLARMYVVFSFLFSVDLILWFSF